MNAPHPIRTKSGSLPYAVAIFISAFLLFQVQLILGKYFLPWFGGTPAMWTTFMFFFQSLLLAGYLYAHLLADLIPPRPQAIIHIGFLILTSVLFLASATAWGSPLTPDSHWKPSSPDHPILRIAELLLLSSGLPYFLLSTTGPLLQSWFAKAHPGLSPYRLYALSNLASFLALISYPFLMEPWLALRTQAKLWAWGFGFFVIASIYCANQLNATRTQPPCDYDDSPRSVNPTDRRVFWICVLWASLATCGSSLFLATTNQICQNLAVVPLLWVLPLGTYLLTLVICFEHTRWYSRAIFQPAFVIGLIAAVYLLAGGAITNMLGQIACYALILFSGCMVVHGELARAKPGPEYLTLFYLTIAAGGAIGGVLVVLVAPRIFTSFAEYPIALWATALFAFLSLMHDKGSWLYTTKYGLGVIAATAALLPGLITLVIHGKVDFGYLFLVMVALSGIYLVTRHAKPDFNRTKARAAPAFIGMAMLLLGIVFFLSSTLEFKNSILARRNFYGLITVEQIHRDEPEWTAYRLMHGRISHGFQFRSAAKSRWITSYFGLQSGVGRAVTALRKPRLASSSSRNLRVGVIGLGVGTLAAYAQPGDYFRFYEINPDVIRIAQDERYFTYLMNCPAKVDIIPGDARLSMERELTAKASQNFNLLVLDAFSGDAPPVHLLTKQAFQIYQQEIQPEGIVAVNVTNTYIDLQPVVATIARDIGMKYVFIHFDGDDRVTVYNDWMLVWSGSVVDKLGISISTPDLLRTAETRVWTDDYSNLFRQLR